MASMLQLFLKLLYQTALIFQLCNMRVIVISVDFYSGFY